MISSKIEKSLWARLVRLCNQICNARMQRSNLCPLCPFNIRFSVTQAACSLAAFLWFIVSTWHMLQLSTIPSHSPACTCNWYSCNRFFRTSSSKGNCFWSPVSKKTITKKAQQWVKLTGIAYSGTLGLKRSWVQTLWSAAEIPASPLLMSLSRGCHSLSGQICCCASKKKPNNSCRKIHISPHLNLLCQSNANHIRSQGKLPSQ